MNWKQEAMERLQRYEPMVRSLQNIPMELARLEEDAKQLRSGRPELERIQSTPGRGESRLVDNIVLRQELKHTYEDAKLWVEITDSAISALTEEEKLVLFYLYVHPHRGAVELLCQELGVEQSSVYRKRDAALWRFTLAMYGAA